MTVDFVDYFWVSDLKQSLCLSLSFSLSRCRPFSFLFLPSRRVISITCKRETSHSLARAREFRLCHGRVYSPAVMILPTLPYPAALAPAAFVSPLDGALAQATAIYSSTRSFLLRPLPVCHLSFSLFSRTLHAQTFYGLLTLPLSPSPLSLVRLSFISYHNKIIEYYFIHDMFDYFLFSSSFFLFKTFFPSIKFFLFPPYFLSHFFSFSLSLLPLFSSSFSRSVPSCVNLILTPHM